MTIALYVLAIIAANIVTAAFQPLHIGPFIVPWGTLLIGCTFIMRDLVQQRYGRRAAYATIVTSLVASAVTSAILGDSLAIVAASALSFALSEASDTEVFTRMKHSSFATCVFTSGLVGGTIDSAVFVIIGLSPLGAGFLPWEAVPAAIIGQLVVKAALQAVGAVVIVGIVKHS